jgi:hypothetical protein
MFRRTYCALLLLVCTGFACNVLHAQTARTITIRVLDGKTGLVISPSNLQVRFKHQNDDGTIEVKIPDGATALSIHATYDNSTSYYVNCDVARQKDASIESWYPVADILTQGIKMPNECGKAKDAAKLKVEVKPGEFVLFVRKRNWWEAAQD